MHNYYAGVEGGASSSKVVLLDQGGDIVASLDNEPSTNVWLIGRDEWCNRIKGMVEKVLLKASLPPTATKLTSLGLCLSGCENDQENLELAAYLQAKYPGLCEHCTVESDTIGSIMTGSPDGGIVLIAGTGSNSLLFHPDGLKVRCGGWGHMIGDYGSAYWIAQLFIRYIIESDEGLNPLGLDLTRARSIVYEHFSVADNLGLLKPLYETFNKTFFAQLGAKIAKAAIEEHDPLSIRVFGEAGEMLAKHVCALLHKSTETKLSIVCVGSIFKSWQLLEARFLGTLDQHDLVRSKCLSIRYLTESSAVGAAYFAAKQAGHELNIEFAKNYQLLCTYPKDQNV